MSRAPAVSGRLTGAAEDRPTCPTAGRPAVSGVPPRIRRAAASWSQIWSPQRLTLFAQPAPPAAATGVKQLCFRVGHVVTVGEAGGMPSTGPLREPAALQGALPVQLFSRLAS